MLTGAVETHVLGNVDVAAKVIVCRRRQEPPGEVALVQDEALNKGFAVEQEAAIRRLNLAQAEVALDLIGLASGGIEDSDVHVIEQRRSGVPRRHLVQVYAAASSLAGPAGHDCSLQSHSQLHLAIRVDREVKGAGVEVRLQVQLAQMVSWERFEPDGLPDTRRRGVEDVL